MFLIPIIAQLAIPFAVWLDLTAVTASTLDDEQYAQYFDSDEEEG